MKPEERRTAIQARVQRYIDQNLTYDEIKRRKAITAVRLAMGDQVPDDYQRRRILGWLFLGSNHTLSTSDLTDAQLETMRAWLQILPAGTNGEWTISQIAAGEIRQMIDEITGTGSNPVLPGMEQGGPVVQAAREQGGIIQPAQPKKKPVYFQFE